MPSVAKKNHQFLHKKPKSNCCFKSCFILIIWYYYTWKFHRQSGIQWTELIKKLEESVFWSCKLVTTFNSGRQLSWAFKETIYNALYQFLRVSCTCLKERTFGLFPRVVDIEILKTASDFDCRQFLPKTRGYKHQFWIKRRTCRKKHSTKSSRTDSFTEMTPLHDATLE